jgi:hypothetical protein
MNATSTPTTTRIECAACHAPLVVSADPNVADAFLRTHGWTNAISTPSKRERVVLHDGSEAVVERPAGVQRRIAWVCGQTCGKYVADGIAKHGGDEHSRSPADLARAGAPADRPARVIPHASCPTCLAELELDYDTAARRAEALAANGWRAVGGSTYCSATCVRMRAVRTAVAPAPVLAIEDAAYQADRVARRTAAGLTTPSLPVAAPATPGWTATPTAKGKAKH